MAARSRPPCILITTLLLLLLEEGILIHGHQPRPESIISGRCHQKCAGEFTKMGVRVRNDKSVANEPLLNSTDFVYCKLGCLRVPGFEEQHHDAFHRGRRLRADIDDTTTESTGRSVPPIISSVDVLCINHHPIKTDKNARMNLSIALNIVPENTRLVDYHVEIYSRAPNAAGQLKEKLMHSTHVLSSLFDVVTEMPDDVTEEVQVRATAFDSMGVVGTTMTSKWHTVGALRDTSEVSLKLRLIRQMWHEERAAALLAIDWPSYRIPSCTLRLMVGRVVGPSTTSTSSRLSEATPYGDKFIVRLDESRMALAPRLQYEEHYAIEIEDPSMTSSSSSPDRLSSSVSYDLSPPSPPSALMITVEACTRLVTDATMCPPPPVSALSYKWNNSDTFIVSWSFDASGDISSRRGSHHFLVTVSLQPKTTRPQTTRDRKASGRDAEDGDDVVEDKTKNEDVCDGRTQHLKKTYTAEVRSATFRLPPSSMECAFSVEVTAVDARNRRSRASVIDSRQAEMEEWQQMDGGGIEIVILWSVFIFMCLMAVSVSIMVLRHQQRAACKKKQLKEQEHHREIMATLYGRETLGRYAPAPSAVHTFLTVPSPPPSEVPRGVYRSGRGWSNENNNTGSKDLSFASNRLMMPDDGYAICELHDESADCQYNLSLFPLPTSERTLCGVPVYCSEDYDLVELVGRGRFGDVYGARFAQSATLVAVKHFNDPSELQAEFAAARSLCLARSSFFPSIIGVVCPPDSLALTALIYEFCPGGDLRSLLLSLRESLPRRPHIGRAVKKVSPRLLSFCRSTALALCELHGRGVVHRDVASRNVLLSMPWRDAVDTPEGMTAKLADLGLCCEIDGEDSRRRLALPWQSPNVRGGSRFGMEDDVWSFGCLLVEVCTLGGEPFAPWNGQLPCESTVGARELTRYIDTIGVGHAKIDAHLATRLRPLIAECLSIDRAARPSIRRVADALGALIADSGHGHSNGNDPSEALLYYSSKDSQFV